MTMSSLQTVYASKFFTTGFNLMSYSLFAFLVVYIVAREDIPNIKESLLLYIAYLSFFSVISILISCLLYYKVEAKKAKE